MKKRIIIKLIICTQCLVLFFSGCNGDEGTNYPIILPEVDTTAPTAEVSPITGSYINVTLPIVISFSESMDINSLVPGGEMGIQASISWSDSETKAIDNTLTISPVTIWSNRTLTIDCMDLAGNPMATLELSYLLSGIVYVDGSNAGSEDGSVDNPYNTIQEGIDAADSLYDIAEIRVAEGTYTDTSPVVRLKEGISIYGGYSSDWSARNGTSIIEDASTDGGSAVSPTCAIEGTGVITNETVVDGFFINGGIGTYSTAIFNKNNCSPTIQNNIIFGGGDGRLNITNYGIYNLYSSPTIRNNMISGGYTDEYGYGIFNSDSSPTIQNNTIYAGVSDIGYGIYIQDSSSPIIENNIIYLYSGMDEYGIYENDVNSDPSSVRNNYFYGCEYTYYDADNVSNLTTIADMETDLMNEGISASGNIDDINDIILPYFVEQRGADGLIRTMADNNWHLTSETPASITQGGLDLSSQFATDKDGNTRTSPWSIGAFEYDE